MFSPKLLTCFTRLYTYPCSKLTFLMPLNCKSSIRELSAKKPIAISYGQNSSTKSKSLLTSSMRTNKLRAKRKSYVPRNFSSEYTTTTANPKVNSTFARAPKVEPQAISTMDAMREFFSHPLTWDRNNGYMNILLGLAIFGYSFCTTCSGDTTSQTKPSND